MLIEVAEEYGYKDEEQKFTYPFLFLFQSKGFGIHIHLLFRKHLVVSDFRGKAAAYSHGQGFREKYRSNARMIFSETRRA